MVHVNFLAADLRDRRHRYRGDWRWMRRAEFGAWRLRVREDTGERVVMVPMVNCGHCTSASRETPYCTSASFTVKHRRLFADQKPSAAKLIPCSLWRERWGSRSCWPVALALRVLDHLKPYLGDWVTSWARRHWIADDAGGLMKGCR
jgi:hypothetical protein